MRWFWIDRFLEFESGHRAVAIKNVAMGQPGMHDGYFELRFPNSLVLEGMAQTGGMLVGESTNYTARLVLGKVTRMTIHATAKPGDTLRYEASVEATSAEGVRLSATSHIDDKLQAEAEYFLAILPDDTGRELFDPVALARLLRVLGVYDVGVTADGTPLEFPEMFAAAEAAALSEVTS